MRCQGTPFTAKNTEGFDSIETVAHAHAVHQASAVKSVTWRGIQKAALVDEECVSLVNLIMDGFPTSKEDMPDNLKRYWSMRDELYVIDGVPFKDKKMLIPKNLRAQVLEGLHAAHQGVSSMLTNARLRFFWPGLDSEVKQLRARCRQCNEQAPSQSQEPPIVLPPPEVPFISKGTHFSPMLIGFRDG